MNYRRATTLTTWVMLLWLSRLPVVFFDFPLVSYAVYACLTLTMVICLLRVWAPAGARAGLITNGWIWLFILAVVGGGVHGAMNVGSIPPWILSGDTADYASPWVYGRSVVLPSLFLPLLSVLIATAYRERETLEAALTPMIALAATFALLIVWDVATSGASLVAMAQPDERNEHLASLGFHSNEFGTMLAVTYALLLGTRQGITSRHVKTALTITLGLAAVALVLTFSRGAYAAFAVTNMLFFMRAKPSRKGALVAIVLLLWFAAPAAIFSRAQYALDSKDVNEISAGRIDSIWVPLLPDISHNWLFGQGLHSIMWTEAQRLQQIFPVSLAHNAYLDLMLDMGVVGALPILAWYAYLWRGFLRESRRDPDPAFRALFYGGHLALASLSLCALTNDRLTPTTPTVVLWIAAGVLLGRQWLHRVPAEPKAARAVAAGHPRLSTARGSRVSRELWGH